MRTAIAFRNARRQNPRHRPPHRPPPSTTYHLRLAAENAAPGAASKEAANTFTTLPPVAKPVVLTANDATEVGKHTAKVSGEIQRPPGADPALDTSCRFEYVTDAQFTANPPGEEFAGAGQAPCVEAPAEAPLKTTDPTAVSAELGGLESGPAGVTYHLRLTARNDGGTTTKNAASTFTTAAVIPPSFIVDPVTDVGYTTAHPSGTVDPGTEGAYWAFEYALADQEEWNGSVRIYGHPGATAANAPAEHVSQVIPCSSPGHLPSCIQVKPGTTYKVRLAALDPAGAPYYSDPPYQEFTTLGTTTPPSANLNPVTGVTATTANFSGAANANAPAGPSTPKAKPPTKPTGASNAPPNAPAQAANRSPASCRPKRATKRSPPTSLACSPTPSTKLSWLPRMSSEPSNQRFRPSRLR